jgi:hypothetical protein
MTEYPEGGNMQTRKFWWLGAAVVLLLVVAIVVQVLTSLDAIVKGAIERYGSQITGTAVRVESVEIEVTSGRGTLRGVTVANPPGFESDSVFRLGEITLEIDAATITRNPVVVDEVVIAAPEVTYEMSRTGRSNIDVLMDNVKRSTSPEGGDATPSPPSTPEEEGEAKRLIVRKFTFRNGRIQADTRAVGGKQMQVDLPPLSLQNVGGSQGAPPPEIGSAVLKAYSGQVAKTVASTEVQRRLDKALGEKAGEAGKAAKGLLERVLE